MYRVDIEYNGSTAELHGHQQRLYSGRVVKGINTINTFTFKMLPANEHFNDIHDLKTLIHVFNDRKNRYEFHGRALYSVPGMNENGLLTREVVCESYLGFLHDSRQAYVEERNWTVMGLLQWLLDRHNAQVESYKQFKIGVVNVTDPNDNLYCGIQRVSTWEAIQDKLISVLGGEIQYRLESDGLYLDYLVQIGELKETAIALSRNMKAIRRESDPTSLVTRLIPLGCKLTREVIVSDENGNERVEIEEVEERLDIRKVNDGVEYIDDVEAIDEYGIRVGYVIWDDVTEAENLKRKGEEWLLANNRIPVKYEVTALDLSLLGLDIDEFTEGNFHPVENKLLQIDDVARLSKKILDICSPPLSTIELGENLKTLSDLQQKQSKELAAATDLLGQTGESVKKLEGRKELPSVSSSDKGKFLRVSASGAWSAEIYESLPEVSTVDSGKFLRVSPKGAWIAESLPNAEEVSF